MIPYTRHRRCGSTTIAATLAPAQVIILENEVLPRWNYTISPNR
jgi:hypothetical protein